MHHFTTSRMRVTAALALVLAGGAADLTAQASRHDRGGTHRKPPLVLERHGWFIAGGDLVQPTFDNLTRTRPVPPPLEERRMLVNEAYVEFFIPHKQRKHAIPIILAHSGRTGIIWLTTPDGREGWAHFFVRRGFPVYVVEPPGVGRAGFPVDQFNRVREGLEDPASQPRLVHGDDSEWELFWIGPAPRELGDGTLYGNQMPTDERSYRHWLHAGSIASCIGSIYRR